MTNIFSLSLNLGHWVKPRSNAWFSRFLLTKYDDDHWVQNFRMTKRILFDIVKQVKPMVVNQNMKCLSTILMEIGVACVFYKLAHGVNFLISLEVFVMGKFTVYFVLHEVCMPSTRPIGI